MTRLLWLIFVVVVLFYCVCKGRGRIGREWGDEWDWGAACKIHKESIQSKKQANKQNLKTKQTSDGGVHL